MTSFATGHHPHDCLRLRIPHRCTAVSFFVGEFWNSDPTGAASPSAANRWTEASSQRGRLSRGDLCALACEDNYGRSIYSSQACELDLSESMPYSSTLISSYLTRIGTSAPKSRLIRALTFLGCSVPMVSSFRLASIDELVISPGCLRPIR